MNVHHERMTRQAPKARCHATVRRGPSEGLLVAYSGEHVILRGLYEGLLAEFLADSLSNAAAHDLGHDEFMRGKATVRKAYARQLLTGKRGTIKLYKEHPGAGGFQVTWVRWRNG